MKRILCAAAAMVMTAGAAQAQVLRPFSVGVAGGVSLPTGDLGTLTNTGFNLAASLSYKPVAIPFGIRVEGAWDQWGIDEDAFGGDADGVDGHVRSLSLTGNAVVDIPNSTPVKPYLIGGLGWYHINTSASGDAGDETVTVTSDAENKLGFNVGGGIRMPLGTLDTYIEARYHFVTGLDDGNFRFVPITFGIRF
jgi:opacity protein-like surface antigen